MNETKLKADLVGRLRKEIPNAIIFRHEDQFTVGTPNISVTWNGKTTWWEVKFAKTQIRSRRARKLTLKELGEQGQCYYVIYLQEDLLEGTYIAKADAVYENRWLFSSHFTVGFDHKFVVNFIKNVHKHKESNQNENR